MSEKEEKTVNRAFSKAIEQESQQIIAARPVEYGLSQHGYKGKNYSEAITHAWGTTTREASIFSDNASVSRQKLDHRFGTDTVTESTVTLPNETGSVTYESSDDSREEQDKTFTSIVRKDKDGNEVYVFESKNPDFADKVGALAAKRIVTAIENDEEQKAA